MEGITGSTVDISRSYQFQNCHLKLNITKMVLTYFLKKQSSNKRKNRWSLIAVI